MLGRGGVLMLNGVAANVPITGDRAGHTEDSRSYRLQSGDIDTLTSIRSFALVAATAAVAAVN